MNRIFAFVLSVFVCCSHISCMPAGLDNSGKAGSVSLTPSFVEDFNDGYIDESIWQIAQWEEHYGQTGRDRCYAEDGFLNLIFIYDPDNIGVDQYLSSAIQTRAQYLYGRWEARLKPSAEEGVLNSFYTIDWDEGLGTRQEIDIEFLTFAFGENTGKVHYAVHAKDHDSFNTKPDVPLDFNPSADFNVWGMEITPDKITWFVNDTVLLEYEYAQNDITIDSTYQLKLNAWTSEDWVQGPPEPNIECKYQIDWIKFYPWIPD